MGAVSYTHLDVYKRQFLYTSIDIIKELHLIYNISNTKYEKISGMDTTFLQLFLFYTATAKAKGSREILYDDII